MVNKDGKKLLGSVGFLTLVGLCYLVPSFLASGTSAASQQGEGTLSAQDRVVHDESLDLMDRMDQHLSSE